MIIITDIIITIHFYTALIAPSIHKYYNYRDQLNRSERETERERQWDSDRETVKESTRRIYKRFADAVAFVSIMCSGEQTENQTDISWVVCGTSAISFPYILWWQFIASQTTWLHATCTDSPNKATAGFGWYPWKTQEVITLMFAVWLHLWKMSTVQTHFLIHRLKWNNEIINDDWMIQHESSMMI